MKELILTWAGVIFFASYGSLAIVNPVAAFELLLTFGPLFLALVLFIAIVKRGKGK